jgi:hypothetical chaperone protein
MHPGPSVGIDFGTTNSAIAVASEGEVRVARFPFMETAVETFRSVLFFENARRGSPVPRPLAGPAAIERYLEPHEGGRLVQSLKSFAASSVFQTTQIGSRQYKLEDLIGVFLKILRAAVEDQFGPLGRTATVGRPVRFVGAETRVDEELALGRLRRAYAIAGFDEVNFAYEPIGAAYSYAQRLRSGELVLIADFGGGTSDFSVIRLEPGARKHAIIATGGVPVGGDTFDARIVRHLVSPMLGLNTSYKSVDKMLPVPASLYRKLESWHHLSFLRSRENLHILQSLRAQATEPQKIDRFLEIVQEDLGYHLHRSVQRAKVELSVNEQAEFLFSDTSVAICKRVSRSDFNGWIADDLRQITDCVEEVLRLADIGHDRVDRVFLTGGSSLVPVLRDAFALKFGFEKLAAGDEFTSVARGLALVTQ